MGLSASVFEVAADTNWWVLHHASVAGRFGVSLRTQLPHPGGIANLDLADVTYAGATTANVLDESRMALRHR
jgi:hypothetical protein